MTSWRICPVAFAVCIAAATVAGQEPAATGVLGEKALRPQLVRLARSLKEYRRGEIESLQLLAAFPRPAEGSSGSTAAAAWYVRALVLITLDHRDVARKALDAAVTAYPSFPDAQMVLVDMDLAAGRRREARERLEYVVSLVPDSEAALLALGDLAQQEGDIASALRRYAAAAKHHVKSVVAHERCARAHIALKHLPAALSEARQIRALEGAASARFYLLVGEIYLAGGDLIAACKALEKGAAVCSESVRPVLLRQLLGWYRLSANRRRTKSTIDRLLASASISATERGELEAMKKEVEELDELAYVLWNFRWQVRAVRDARVPAAGRATAVTFLCHVRAGETREHLNPARGQELDLLWWSAVNAVTRTADAEALRILCTHLTEHPDPVAAPFLARLVHPSLAPATVRRGAVDALGAAWRPSLLPLLLQCLEDRDKETAHKAARVLHQHIDGVPPEGDTRERWRRWARTPAGRNLLAETVDPFASESLWAVVAEFKTGTHVRIASPALGRAVMPILRDQRADPELFINAYMFLERNVDDPGWRGKASRIDPLRDSEVPELAATIERWYQRGPSVFVWEGKP